MTRLIRGLRSLRRAQSFLIIYLWGDGEFVRFRFPVFQILISYAYLQTATPGRTLQLSSIDSQLFWVSHLTSVLGSFCSYLGETGWLVRQLETSICNCDYEITPREFILSPPHLEHCIQTSWSHPRKGGRALGGYPKCGRCYRVYDSCLQLLSGVSDLAKSCQSQFRGLRPTATPGSLSWV